MAALCRRTCIASVCTVLVLVHVHALAAPGHPPSQSLPVDNVRIGMKGYGLTVFQGTRIEPFAVEVVSVMYNFQPGRHLIWVLCPDQRMQRSGPVQGMSGSPIYLWGDDEPHELGKGGRLIGAFAWGYSASKVCYVGVEPIGQMHAMASRVRAAKTTEYRSTAQSAPGLLTRLIGSRAFLEMRPDQTWRARTIAKLIKPSDKFVEANPGHGSRHPPRNSLGSIQTVPALPVANMVAPSPTGFAPQRMLLPLTMRSPKLAEAMAPLLTPLGMIPIATGHAAAGVPPPWMNFDAAQLEPGSVVSIPLAYGDLDLAASGTVTDVDEQGLVYALGHAMSGWGQTALPMATGFVHFILPGATGSFKVGGSLKLTDGAIVRDERSGVVGMPGATYLTAPVNVEVNMAGHPPSKAYKYQVVVQEDLTPVIAAVVVAHSLVAVQKLPLKNTVRLTGELSFSGGRQLSVGSLLPWGSPLGVLTDLLPALGAMAENPYEPVMLESIQMRADVEDDVRLGSILDGWLDRVEVSPGDQLGITVRVQKQGAAPTEKHVELTIPKTLVNGNYELFVCDAPTYVSRLLADRPHLATATTVDELFATIKRIMGVASDALYVMMNVKQKGLAVGQQELPQLPSSRQALLETPMSTLTVPYREWAEVSVPMDLVPTGNLKFTVRVNKLLAHRRSSPP